jgi:hypothetical protein
MERERQDENHVNARASQSEQHVSASPVYYCLLRWLVKSKLAHLTFSFFNLARPQKSLPIPDLMGLLPCSQTDVDLDFTTRQYIPEDCELKTLQLFPLST